MSTDVNLLAKGLKKLMILLGLMIVSPIILNIAFKALKKYSDSDIYFAYGWLILGVFLIIFTIFFAFNTFKTILDALFNKSD